MSRVRAQTVAALLFGSGFCALIYEVAWLRLLRLVFGASTAANAAVLAIFLGGLGFGGWWLGRRADAARNPLAFYARLEFGVAVAAAASPLLVMLVRSLYLALGGTAALGTTGGTLLRLGLSTLVLGFPTVLMGGTLPAAVRAVERRADAGRRQMGLIYGANTLGAVAGSLCASFLCLETVGTNRTVWLASVINLMVALLASGIARRVVVVTDEDSVESRLPAVSSAPVALIWMAAAVVGFAFLLMELVWYRMLAPLLGGSSYTFGLILAVALLGIGVGSVLYAVGAQQRRPTLMTFAASCALEALCIALPYAAGDRIAVAAMVMRPLGFIGFLPLVGTWLAISLVVVFPAAVVSGYQFPLLVGLLGAGDQRVGREVGQAYAWNTVGAIVGSLAGGFGLLPLLSAPGVWRLVVYLLIGLAVISVARALRDAASRSRALTPLLVAAVSVLLCRAEGPTAFWRHSPIGAGRLHMSIDAPNDLQRLFNERRRPIIWEADGVESTVGLDRSNAYAFIVHGKSDGNAIADAPTQVMSGLIGALLHLEPKRVLVIGLGTGSTAGWLAQVPSVERVDVVELEPAILHVAEVCSPVNQNVLANPKVHIVIGDGREFLLTTSERYDIIFSEPSNPYRAGVASLFTHEFYDAVRARLTEAGVFVQWVQAYEVGASTLRSVYATVGRTFPAVETWEVNRNHDLVLTARQRVSPHDVAQLRALVATEPYRSALQLVWGVTGVEGFYSRYLGNAGFGEALAHADDGRINTDDRTLIEFEFARTVGREGLLNVDDLRALAVAHGNHRPPIQGGAIDWNLADELRSLRAATEASVPETVPSPDAALNERLRARQAYASGNINEARLHWQAQTEGPKGPRDITMLAEMYTVAGDARALEYIDALQSLFPPEAEALLAQWHHRAGEVDSAAAHLLAAFSAYREFPWAHPIVLNHALALAWTIATQRPQWAGELFTALAEPFAVRVLDEARMHAYADIGLMTDFDGKCIAALAPFEPHTIWDRRFLEERARCYDTHHHPLAERARRELATYLANAPGRIDQGLTPAQP
ncbi:MAG: fused MFS/spermidine synthase [Deltaproteobacteria bacterium]|nr:fused MFS/spermidine synthase [Deltaproteobacteria bacterium]MBI3391238.1 fused MFS/spermidine synthase [Deltaproteobacteria bacterium]